MLIYVAPLQTASVQNKRYFLTITDDFSRYVTAEAIRTKDEAFQVIEAYDRLMFTKTGRHIGCIRSDRGLEFKNNKFSKMCNENGTLQQFTTKYTPQQGGTHERINLTLLDLARAMLLKYY